MIDIEHAALASAIPTRMACPGPAVSTEKAASLTSWFDQETRLQSSLQVRKYLLRRANP